MPLQILALVYIEVIEEKFQNFTINSSLFSDSTNDRFVIFSLLLPYVHRDGGVGQQARDALLLCMALSASHTAVGQYIAQHSNFCPVRKMRKFCHGLRFNLHSRLWINLVVIYK